MKPRCRPPLKKAWTPSSSTPTAVIGPYDFQPSHQGQMLLSMAAAKTLPALVDGGFDWVDVRDVVYGGDAGRKIGSARFQVHPGRTLGFAGRYSCHGGEKPRTRAPGFRVPVVAGRGGRAAGHRIRALTRHAARFIPGLRSSPSIPTSTSATKKPRESWSIIPAPALSRPSADTLDWFAECGELPREIK